MYSTKIPAHIIHEAVDLGELPQARLVLRNRVEVKG
jgi:hypothetical protein